MANPYQQYRPGLGRSTRVAPKAPARPAAAPPAPVAAPVSQTLAQVANQRVNQQLAPQIASQNQFNARQAQVIQSFANSLLGKLQPIAGQVAGQYDQAIGQTGALANQAATFLQNANPTGQVSDLLRSAGAPQAQQNQIASQLGQTFGGGAGVLSFTGGAIPGGQMASDKAAMYGQAAQLPGLAALKGQQDLASALWQQGQDRQKLEATRPALYQAAAQDIRTNQNARAKLAETQRQDAIGNRFKADTLNQHASEYGQTRSDKLTQFATTAKAKRANDFLNKYVQLTKLGLDTTKLEQQYQHTLTTEKQGSQRIAISQQNANTSAARAASSSANASARLKLAQRHEATYEQTAAAKKAAGNRGISATSYANLRKQALKQADLYYFGKPPSKRLVKMTDGSQKWVNVPGSGISGLDYPVAVKKLMDGYSLKKPDAQAILNDFYAPGEAGRPMSTKQKATNKTAKGAAATIRKAFGGA